MFKIRIKTFCFIIVMYFYEKMNGNIIGRACLVSECRDY